MKTLRKAHEVDFWVWKEGWSKRQAAHREPDSCTYYSTQKAVCQVLVLPVTNFTVEEVFKDTIQCNASERGSKGYGSTNK